MSNKTTFGEKKFLYEKSKGTKTLKERGNGRRPIRTKGRRLNVILFGKKVGVDRREY